jgi:hypothetical protein
VLAVLVAVLAAGLAASLLLLGPSRLEPDDDTSDGDGPGRASINPDGSGRGLGVSDAERSAATSALLEDLRRALAAGDVAAARSLARPKPGRRLAAAVARNVTRLGVEALDLRRIAEAPATPDLVRRFGAGSWVAEVQVVWRYAGIDERPVSSTIQLVLSARPGGALLDDTRPALAEQAPLWLLEPLTVRQRGRVRVSAPDPPTAAGLLTLASRAAAAVHRRLPAWEGALVVEAPASAAGFRAASGVAPPAARRIAAVTTTADGVALPGSPERVFVNPRVFEPLGAAGQQIVLSHEATHVAVDAAVSPAPTWLSEGLADWVALADSHVPVRVLASQALDRVRRSGAPPRLPGRAAFAAGNPDVGAAYESAWLAVRLLAETHGERALLRFHRAVDRRVSVDRAFRRTLGTSGEAFTRSWRRELLRLAG